MMYTVYWVAGNRDGEVLATFSNERDAVKFAQAFYREHESEFDSMCGGVGIDNENGDAIEW